jgi:hypothetical protein
MIAEAVVTKLLGAELTALSAFFLFAHRFAATRARVKVRTPATVPAVVMIKLASIAAAGYVLALLAPLCILAIRAVNLVAPRTCLKLFLVARSAEQAVVATLSAPLQS